MEAHGYTVFLGARKLARGSLSEVAAQAKKRFDRDPSAELLIFEDETGRTLDLNLRGTLEQALGRLPRESDEDAVPRGRGRPKLGVVAREVTLLPRHWDWLSSQPGGASVALRKLVDQARHTTGDSERVRLAQEGAYRFMSAMGGNLPNFEEASRALFAYDRRRFSELLAAWPEDIRDYAINLAFADLTPADG